MKNLQKIISILFFIGIFNSTIKAATITWVGGFNANEWNQVINWSPMIVPGINDDVIIPSTWTSEITIAGANASCRSITYTGTGFSININNSWEFLLGGDLNISGNSEIYGLGGIEIVGNNPCNLNFSDSTHLAMSHINVKSTADVNLNNHLTMPFGRISIYSGHFITHGNDVTVNAISVVDGSTARSLNIENSEVTLNTLNLFIRDNGQFFASNSIVNNNLMIATDGNVSFNIINSAKRTTIGTVYNNAHFSVSQLNASGDISILGSTTQTAQGFSITQFNILSSPSVIRLTPEPYVSGYAFYTIQSPNNCAEVQFTDGFEVSYNQVIFNIIGGAVLSKASMANIRVASGSLIVDEGTDVGNNSGITFNNISSKTYYWINGSGNWIDANHWSLTSGGTTAGCIPGLKDNAIFDNASGFSAGDTVTISNHTFCKDLIALPSIVNKPVFNSTGLKNGLNISGNVDLRGFSGYNIFYPIFFLNKTSINIRTGSHIILDDVYMMNIGTCQLQDPINCYNGQKSILHMLGNFVTNGHPVTISALVSKGSKVSGSQRGITLFNSKVNIGQSNLSPGSVLVYSENLTLNAGTSNFIFKYLLNVNSEFKIEGGDHLQFYNVKFLNKVGTPQMIFNEKSTFNKIQFEGNGTLWNGSFVSGPEMSGTDTLVITGNHRYEIEKGRMLNIRKKVVHQHTLCNEMSIITSTSLAERAYIHSNGITALGFDHTWMENISGSGANLPFTVLDGVNGGNNLNLNFLSINNPRIFYWNGEGSTTNWSEGINWNIGVQPHPGNNDDLFVYNINGCIPGFNDSVVFHPNSFPVNDTATIDMNVNFCGMNWMPGTGMGHRLSGNSQYTINNYGGLQFDYGLTTLFGGDFFFRSPYTREIKFNSVAYNGILNFYQLGKTLLQDNMVCNGYAIKFLAGSFTSNNHSITTNHFFIHHNNAPLNNNIIQFGSSTLHITGTFSNQLFNNTTTFFGDNTTVKFYSPNATFLITGDLQVINFGHVDFTITYGDATLSSNTYYGTGMPYFKHVNFESSAYIFGDNSMDTVIMAEGKYYHLQSNKTQFINQLLYSKGSPCYRTTIQSTVPGTRAYINNTNCNLLVEHARLRDIEGIMGSCGSNNYLVGVGGEDLGNNFNWNFIPGNPIQGLGPDTMLTCNTLPYLQTTFGFGRYESLTWSNGATTSSLLIDSDTTIEATVIYSPTCIVNDKRTFTFENHINQIGIVDHISCNGMNNGSIELQIEDVDSNFNQTWVYANNQTGHRNHLLENLSPGTYISIVSVPGYESVCNDTAEFTILEPEQLTVTLDTTIAGKCSDPDGIVMITSAGGAGPHSYAWNNEETTEDNYKAWGGFNEVVVSDTNHCTAKISVDMQCIEHINIPELITPNGDGFGDEWEIIDLFRLYPDNDVKIINRWGNTVYHKQGYDNQFTGLPNTGTTLSTGYLPSGTYFYIIDLGPKYKTLTGYVELVY